MVDLANEKRWQAALKSLKADLNNYEAAQKSNDEGLKKKEGLNIVESMQRIGDSHPDPNMRDYWKKKAEEFLQSDETGKEHILAGVGKGLAILLITPFALLAGVLFGAGTLIYGAGVLVKGLGTVLTGGLFR
jgi:hypothetical protein